jgi:hypothetical protein
MSDGAPEGVLTAVDADDHPVDVQLAGDQARCSPMRRRLIPAAKRVPNRFRQTCNDWCPPPQAGVI